MRERERDENIEKKNQLFPPKSTIWNQARSRTAWHSRAIKYPRWGSQQSPGYEIPIQLPIGRLTTARAATFKNSDGGEKKSKTEFVQQHLWDSCDHELLLFTIRHHQRKRKMKLVRFAPMTWIGWSASRFWFLDERSILLWNNINVWIIAWTLTHHTVCITRRF